ncbi:hypothetical protein ACFL25_01045 [Patescibacteria group bacterium]
MENEENNQSQNQNIQDVPSSNNQVVVQPIANTAPVQSQTTQQSPQPQSVESVPVQPQPQPQAQDVQTQPNTESPVNIPAPIEQKPKQDSSNKMLIIGLIFLGIAVGICLLTIILPILKKDTENQETNVVQNPPQNITQKLPSPTPNPLVNWKGYATPTYTLKYPNDVTCVGYTEWDQSKWDQSAATKRDLINKANFCLTNLDDVELIKKHQDDLKKDKIYRTILHSSDAHSFDRIGKSFLWVKADPTFEGLRQVLYEPSERVAIQTNDPTPPRSNYTFEEINVGKKRVNDELTMLGTKILLNNGLVAVAGGKGSGKTALVDLVAHCFEDRNKADYENSFVYRIYDQAPQLKVKVKFKDGTEFEKRIGDGSYFQECEYLYIAQGELEKYVSSEDLNQYVHNLIINSPKVKESISKYEYLKLQRTNNSLMKNIEDISGRIENLMKQTGDDVLHKLLLKKRQFEASIKDFQAQIEGLERGLDKTALKKVKKIQKSISKLKGKKILLTSLSEELDKAQVFIESDVNSFNEIIININKLQKEAGIPSEFKTLQYEDAEEIFEKNRTVDAEIKDIIGKIQKKEGAARKFELKLQSHTKLLGRKNDAKNELDRVEEQIVELKQSRTVLKQQKKQRLNKYGDVIRNTIDLQKKYKAMIKAYSGDRGDVLKDLEFLPRMKFDKNTFLVKAEDVLDNRKVDIKEGGEFKVIFKLYEKILGGDGKYISDILKEMLRLELDLLKKVKFSSAITTGDFFNFIYDNYLTVEPVIKYKKVELRRLSLGQKATVLIKIYLAEGDKPIIIDSHDDFLDNKYIMSELIEAIRVARKSRQVILVSNNGNVVVNSDAEQVIIADKDDNGKISYTSGSLENPLIIDKAIEVLEGGKEAFQKRQRKYRMP